MKKSHIRLRKKLWLPIKYAITKFRLVAGMKAMSNRQIYNRLVEEKDNLLRAERKRVRDTMEIEKFKTIINTIEWLLNNKD